MNTTPSWVPPREETDEEKRAKQALAQAQDILSLASMPGWKTWLQWIADGIESRRDALCDPRLDLQSTNMVRAEIALLRALYLKATSVDAAAISGIEEHIKGLRESADARHYVASVTRSPQ
jgi:hypothetical protein